MRRRIGSLDRWIAGGPTVTEQADSPDRPFNGPARAVRSSNRLQTPAGRLAVPSGPPSDTRGGRDTDGAAAELAAHLGGARDPSGAPGSRCPRSCPRRGSLPASAAGVGAVTSGTLGPGTAGALDRWGAARANDRTTGMDPKPQGSLFAVLARGAVSGSGCGVVVAAAVAVAVAQIPPRLAPSSSMTPLASSRSPCALPAVRPRADALSFARRRVLRLAGQAGLPGRQEARRPRHRSSSTITQTPFSGFTPRPKQLGPGQASRSAVGFYKEAKNAAIINGGALEERRRPAGQGSRRCRARYGEPAHPVKRLRIANVDPASAEGRPVRRHARGRRRGRSCRAEKEPQREDERTTAGARRTGRCAAWPQSSWSRTAGSSLLQWKGAARASSSEQINGESRAKSYASLVALLAGLFLGASPIP
jgi:hypothetical protein